MSEPTTNQQSPKKHNPEQNSGKQQPNNGSRADQPTPVSPSTQSQGQGQEQRQASQQANGNPPTPSGQASSASQSASSDLKQVGREIVGDATREIKGEIQGAVSQVKDQASDLTQAAQEKATTYLDEQKGVAAERLEGVAQAIRSAGEGFSERDEGTLAHYSERLAEEIESFSGNLREREIGALLDDAKQLAYRQPEWFVAGALAAGFALGRFFKSSSRPRYGRDEQGHPYNNPSDYSYGYASNYGRGYSEGEYSGAPAGRYMGDYEGGTTSDYGRGFDYRNPEGGSGGYRAASPSALQPAAVGQVTTHGLGTGQSTQRSEEIGQEFGQEFAQGEQSTNYAGDKSAIASSLPSGSLAGNPKATSEDDWQEKEDK